MSGTAHNLQVNLLSLGYSTLRVLLRSTRRREPTFQGSNLLAVTCSLELLGRGASLAPHQRAVFTYYPKVALSFGALVLNPYQGHPMLED